MFVNNHTCALALLVGTNCPCECRNNCQMFAIRRAIRQLSARSLRDLKLEAQWAPLSLYRSPDNRMILKQISKGYNHYLKKQQPSWMEGGAVGHNFERDTPRDHLCQVWPCEVLPSVIRPLTFSYFNLLLWSNLAKWNQSWQ
jgi:hypothetical protein